mgnify:CR=1|jgi:hypothetical protein|tara:strand:- start:270 stop:575 length:306 start_codon:yes stop_codon:yes gene_type:complete
MLVEIKELCCSSNYDNNGYVDEEDTVFINTKSIAFVRHDTDYVKRDIPNPEFDYDYNFVDIETHIEVREIEKVYQVHTLGCSREEVIVIDEAAMTLLRELV